MGVNTDAIEVNDHRDAGGGGGGVAVDLSRVSCSSHHHCSIPVIMDSSDGNGDADDDLQLKLQRSGYDDDDEDGGDDEEDYDRENFNSLDYDDIEALDLTEPADVDMVIGQEEGEEEEMDGLDGDRDGQQSSFLHWRVVNQCIRFSEEELRYSVLALVEWAQLLLKGPRSDEKSYCSIVLPLLHVWSSASKHRSGMMMMSRKISNKDSSLLSMYQLAVSVEADDDCCYSMPIGWMDKSHCCYSRLVAAMAARVNIEQIVQRDTLLSMTRTLSGILKEVQKSEGIDCSRHLQVIDACTKKAVQRLHYSSGRTRTSKVVYVSYDQPIGDDDDDVVDDNDEEKMEGDEDIQPIAPATGFRDTSDLLPPSKRGKARQNASSSSSSSTSAPVVIAWNRFKRVSSLHEDPLVTAMREYSEAAALLTKKLLVSDPTSIHTANELFKEVMRQLNPYETVYAVEYHLPINRMYALHPKTAIACLFAAHDYAVLRKHSEALEKYLEAYCIDDKQPLTCLCIATYLIMLSNHKLSYPRYDTLAKGLAFLHRYVLLRRMSSSEVRDSLQQLRSRVDGVIKRSHRSVVDGEPTATANMDNHCRNRSDEFQEGIAWHQETMYNLGRCFHELRLYHLAVEQYLEALELANSYPFLLLIEDDDDDDDGNGNGDGCSGNRGGRVGGGSVTREAAHNLVLIYKQSDSHNLALEIMLKYLVV